MKQYYKNEVVQEWFEKLVEKSIENGQKYEGYTKEDAAKLIFERNEAFVEGPGRLKGLD